VQATLHPDYNSKEFNDWMLHRDYFLKYDKEFGPFDLDGASDNDGRNNQVTGIFCCPAQPFQENRLETFRRVWLNAPYDCLEDFIGHYLRCKINKHGLRAVFFVPKWRSKPWYKLLRNFRLIEELPRGSSVLTCPTKDGSGRRMDVGPTTWATQIFADDKDGVQFLPPALREPTKEYWTHVKVLVLSGKYALLSKYSDDTVWFPVGEQRSDDARPDNRATRILEELKGYRMSEANLTRVGTETTESSKTVVFVVVWYICGMWPLMSTMLFRCAGKAHP
jgi:hypothetical protein